MDENRKSSDENEGEKNKKSEDEIIEDKKSEDEIFEDEISEDEIPEVDEIEEARVAEMEENSMKRVASQTAMPQHLSKKLKYNDLYKPPTATELNDLKEAEMMFHSSLFRLQIDELMKEVKIKKKYQTELEKCLQALKVYLKCLPQSDLYKLGDKSLKKILKVPISMYPKSKKGSFKFLPPVDVCEIGSYALDIVCSPKPVIDLALKVPKRFWQHGDHLNFIYHRKRALYLAFIAKSLKETEMFETLKYSFLNDCHVKPVLILYPKGKLGKHCSIRLLPYPEERSFKLNRFIPSRNNIRKSWFYDTDTEDLDIPTPYYNSTVLFDILLPEMAAFLKQTITSSSVKNGLILLKVWLFQREIFGVDGPITGFVVTMLVAYLILKHKINNLMSSYQVFRITLSALKRDDWCTKGISLCKDPSSYQPSLDDFHQCQDTVFIEPSGFLNVCYFLHKDAFLRISHEAALALDILDSASGDSFTQLFMTKLSFSRKFECCFWLQNNDELAEYCKTLQLENSVLDHGGNCVAPLIQKMSAVLKTGLKERVLLLSNKNIQVNEWDVDAAAPSPHSWKKVSFGLLLNEECIFNNLEKGPPADSAESRPFRQFWGEKSELRRFQDGSIHEAVLWPAETIKDKRSVTPTIIKYILQKHAGVNADNLVFTGNDVDLALDLPKALLQQCFSPYGTGEELFVKMFHSYNDLVSQLRKLPGLPLAISSVQGSSPAFRFSEVFPPFSRAHVIEKEDIITENSCVSFGVHHHRAPDWVSPLEVVINFEGTGKWPDDVNAIIRVKAALYLKIAELLKDKFALCNNVTPDHVDVLKDGYVFRLRIACHKEIGLLKQIKSPDGMVKIKDNDESRELHRQTEVLPKLNSALHGLHQQHNTFGTACRLAKRWVFCQLMHSYVDEVVVDMIMAHLFLCPEPFTRPSSPQLAFQRFLSFVEKFDWTTNSLVVNFNNGLSKSEIADLQSSFTSQRSMLPPMVIITPFDKSGTLFTKDFLSLVLFNRLLQLAAASSKTLEEQLANPQPDTFKQIFRPPLNPYDVIINLKQRQVPKLCYALDESKCVKYLPLKTYQRMRNEKMPILDFDPVEFYLQDLKAAFDDIALFFYDTLGGKYIAVIWKPDAFQPKPFKVSTINGRLLSGADASGSPMTLPNTQAILECFKKLGAGLIAGIEEMEKSDPIEN